MSAGTLPHTPLGELIPRSPDPLADFKAGGEWREGRTRGRGKRGRQGKGVMGRENGEVGGGIAPWLLGDRRQ